MTSCHDVTKPDLPISACRCPRTLLLFLFPWFFRSLSSKMLMIFSFAWCRDVMTSCHDVTKPDLPISACRCARKLLLFLFPWVLGHWVQKCYDFQFVWCSCIMTSCHDVTKIFSPIPGCRFDRKMILFMILWFFWLLILKMLVFMYLWDDIMS